MTVQQAKESVKITSGPSSVFFCNVSSEKWLMRVWGWRMNNCGILALVYMGGRRGRADVFFV